MKKSVPFFLLFSVILFAACRGPEPLGRVNPSVYGESDVLAGLSFPPCTHRKQIEFTIRTMRDLSVDRIRIAADWRDREPERGAYYWDPMDIRMEAARESGVSVFLTLPSLAPSWAALIPGEDGSSRFDEGAWERYIEELLLRYDNIDKIQFGNEWETGTPDGTAYRDPDSVRKFVLYNNILYDSVKRLSPGTRVVLGGLTRTYPLMEAFVRKGRYPDFSGIELAKGATPEYLRTRIDKLARVYEEYHTKKNIEYVLEHARYDMIDIHLYDDPENWAAYLSVLPEAKPILVSEFGGPNSEFENTAPSYQAERMADYIAAVETLPVEEAYYFKLVDSPSSYHRHSGLYYAGLRAKPAKEVFAERLSEPKVLSKIPF